MSVCRSPSSRIHPYDRSCCDAIRPGTHLWVGIRRISFRCVLNSHIIHDAIALGPARRGIRQSAMRGAGQPRSAVAADGLFPLEGYPEGRERVTPPPVLPPRHRS